MSSYLTSILITLLLTILKVVCLLVAIAYFTLAERKIMAAVQRRVGPNVVGPFGLLQPLADGLKLAGKELAVPAQASSRIFLSVAMSVLLFALSGWTVIPFGMFDHSEYLSNRVVVKILAIAGDSSSLTRVGKNAIDLAELKRDMKELRALEAAGLIEVDDDGGTSECIECQVDPSDAHYVDSDLTEEERAWVEREVMRFIGESHPTRELTEQEMEDYSDGIIAMIAHLKEFAINYRTSSGK